jgi:hypothetical protein
MLLYTNKLCCIIVTLKRLTKANVYNEGERTTV